MRIGRVLGGLEVGQLVIGLLPGLESAEDKAAVTVVVNLDKNVCEFSAAREDLTTTGPAETDYREAGRCS